MSWIKVDTTLVNKPEVVQISRILKKKREEVLGYLVKFWCLIDGITENGTLPSYDKPAIDELTGLKGFAKAMQVVGWLEFSDDGCIVTRFEKHNGASAKKRAESALRQSRFRHTKHNKTVTENALRGALPREEKSRSNNSRELLPGAPACACEGPLPPGFSLEKAYELSELKGWPKGETDKWFLWHDAKGWKGMANWESSLALWMTRVRADDSEMVNDSAKNSAPGIAALEMDTSYDLE